MIQAAPLKKLIFFLITCTSLHSTLSALPAAETRLLKKIKRVTRLTDGMVGIAAFHPASGFTFGVHECELFPMASTYKVPLALLFLKKVDEGTLDLAHRVVIKDTDIRSGDSFIAKRFAPEMSLPYRELFRLMIELSDNTATDLIFKAVGGPAAVTSFLKTHGITQVNVQRTTLKLLSDYCGIQGLPAGEECTLKQYRHMYQHVNLKKRVDALRHFYSDPHDNATPRGMIEVLKLIEKKGVLKPESRNLLIDSMRLCQTGLHKIAGHLPGIAIAQKTGSLNSWPNDQAVTNDVAVITLPDGSTMYLVIFIKQSTRSKGIREKVIARSAQLIVNHVRHYHKIRQTNGVIKFG